jgi:hypothetical protein
LSCITVLSNAIICFFSRPYWVDDDAVSIRYDL